MNFLYFLGIPLGYVMEWIYRLIPNYGWDIILFTLIIRVASIPLAISQQKTSSKMSAFQPIMMDLQKKYRNNQEKYQEELNKLQQDYGYNPTSGCLPMLLNFLVLFGVIDVVYRPLQRILHVSAASMEAAAAVLGVKAADYTLSAKIISAVLAGDAAVAGSFNAAELAAITEFSGHMSFFGIDLLQVPKLSLAPETLPLLVFPVLSLLTMFISTHLSMRASGQEMQPSMKVTMYLMPLMFVYFCFTVPVAFSLYYTISNVLMAMQSAVLRRVIDPDKIKAQVLAEMEKKKKEQRRGVKNTTIKVRDEKTGQVNEISVSASEMNRRRLEYARKLDEERYRDERTVPLSELNREAAAGGEPDKKEDK